MKDAQLFQLLVDETAYDQTPCVEEIFPEILHAPPIVYLQKKTGYCWLMAFLNAFCPAYSLVDTENLIHADKLLKADHFLKEMEGLAAEDELTAAYLNHGGISDRGQYHMAAYLMKNFGGCNEYAVSREWKERSGPDARHLQADEENALSRERKEPDATGTINATLSGILRWYGYRIREEKELQNREAIRKEALQKTEMFLNACYGELRESGSSALPGELMGKTSEYTSICSRNRRDYGKEYVIGIDGYEGVHNQFLNVEDDLFQSSLDRQIAEEGKCIIGFDAGRFGFPEKGVYTDACLRVDADGFGFPEKGIYTEACLRVDPAGLASEEGLCPARDTIWESRTGCITHMAVLVSRRKYKDGKIYYLAADSGSAAERHDGYWALEYNWMRKYVLQAVVRKKYLQKRIDFQRIERQREMPWTFF